MNTASNETNRIVWHLLMIDALAAHNQGHEARAAKMRHVAEHCKAGTEGALAMARKERADWAEFMAE